MQSLIKNIIIVFILLNNSYCFADQSKQDRQELLMKGAYEYEKKADYTNDPEGKRKSDEYIKQHEDMQETKRRIEENKEKAEIYNAALKMQKEEKKFSSKKDMTHEVENKIMKQYKVSRSEAHRMIQDYDPRAEKVWQTMVQAETQKNLQKAKQRLQQERKQQNSKK